MYYLFCLSLYVLFILLSKKLQLECVAYYFDDVNKVIR